MAKSRDAFIEANSNANDGQPTPRAHTIRLPLNEDGTIQWDNVKDSQKELFAKSVSSDATALEMIGLADEKKEGSEIADTTVLATANAIMAIEAVGVCTLGRRMAPILQELPIPVAVKACSISMEELQPIMEPSKRLIAKYTPAEWLQHQDLVTVVEHLGKIGAQRFADCLKLASEIHQQIEQKRRDMSAPPQPSNEKNNKVVEIQ